MKTLLKNILPGLLLLLTAPANALDSQWYVGIGGGTSFLAPNPVDQSIDEESNSPVYSTLFLGRDLGNLLSIQFQASALGEAELSNSELVDYSAFDASIIYRLYDSRDMGFNPDGFGLAIYGKASFGAINRDIGVELPLEIDSSFYFGGGLGAELFLWGPVSLRLELVYVDRDAQYGALSLVTRFGGSGPGRVPGPRPISPSNVPANDNTIDSAAPTTTQTTDGTTLATSPEVVAEAPLDSEIDYSLQNNPDTDRDGVGDSSDSCAGSAAGYPVNDSGCPLLNGVLTGVSFETGTATLAASSFRQLDYLAGVLKKYRSARIQLRSHTDSSAGEREQSILTRARLRTLGTYLVRQGISANRLVLRSLGGSQPAYDNATPEGRAGNNRIEVLEQL